MPAARGLLRGDRPRQPRSRDQDDQDARRRVRRGVGFQDLRGESAMSAVQMSAVESVPLVKPKQAISIETVGMTKIFGSMAALEDVSLKVEAGTFHALLGENGAGKSTLVKCIMGYYHATSGSVLLDGAEVDIRNPRD